MRLDLDWNWIPYAQEKGVMISINPDAHNLNGIRDIEHGVNTARKGGLTQNYCLNCYDISKFNEWLSSKA
jgi:DNA polymerase (family 10)